MSQASARKRLTLVLLGVLAAYLALYTWNLRTGYLDRLAANSGLEFVGLVLSPAATVHDTVLGWWNRYIHLMDVEEENARLRQALTRMALDSATLREDAAALKRLERALDFSPPPAWNRRGVRVLTQRFGPAGALETITLDRGRLSGVADGQPVVTPDGVLGQVLKAGPGTSVVLLLRDANSRIPVVGAQSRSAGILAGRGSSRPLSLKYVPLKNTLVAGELLVTSGLGGIFPRGIPAARVMAFAPSDDALFQNVIALPLVESRNVSEAFVLWRIPEILQDTAPDLPEGGAPEVGEGADSVPDGAPGPSSDAATPPESPPASEGP